MIKINENLCKDCGICVMECIHNRKKPYTNHVDHDFKFCNSCLHCYAICPENAIELDKNFINKNREREIINYKDFIFHLQQRRSTRRFADKHLPEELLDDLLNAANYIPSGGNNQEVKITVLENKVKQAELRKEIINYYNKMFRISKNRFLRALLKVIGSKKVKESMNDDFFLEKLQDMQEKFKIRDLAFYNAPVVLFFHSRRLLPTAKEDAILAAYNIALTAETLGLGSCFVSMAKQAMVSRDKCKDIVQIDRKDHIFAVLVVGYPVAKYRRVVYRENKNIYLVD